MHLGSFFVNEVSVPMDAAIVTQGLTRRFGDIVAVEELSLTIPQGEVLGFLGHNGAGKTTTVRLLNGVLSPDAGTMRVLGLDPVADGPRLRRRTGVLTETPSLDERLSGRTNLTLYAEMYGVPRAEVAPRVQSLLEAFELAERSDEPVRGYSRGMRQRLALARALLHRPDILFLDEPTAGLDPVATRQVHQLITRLSREEGRTIFLCTHNLNEAQMLCDRVAVLERGRLLALGTPAQLAEQLGFARRVQIQVAPAQCQQARSLVAELHGQTESSGEDGTLTVAGVARDETPALVARLVQAGVAIYAVTPQEPSLAAMYFALQAERKQT
jgi:ABC-2 type transport system ATP-binding protein